MVYEEKKLLLMSCSTCVVGYIVSIFTCPDVFPRFGALIVCLGIYFALQDVKGIWSELVSNLKKDRSDAIINHSNFVNPAESEKHLELYKEGVEKINAIYEENLNTAVENKNRALRLEAWILIVGTVIWAFGDWLVFDFGLSNFQCN